MDFNSKLNEEIVGFNTLPITKNFILSSKPIMDTTNLNALQK